VDGGSRQQTGACPRCGAPTHPGDRFCANCGLRLPSMSGATNGRSSTELLVWLGPAFGGFIGFVIGEAVVGQLSSDGPVLLPIAVLVAAGAILGGPALAWVVDRVRPPR